jgi:hypothetical protein
MALLDKNFKVVFLFFLLKLSDSNPWQVFYNKKAKNILLILFKSDRWKFLADRRIFKYCLKSAKISISPPSRRRKRVKEELFYKNSGRAENNERWFSIFFKSKSWNKNQRGFCWHAPKKIGPKVAGLAHFKV